MNDTTELLNETLLTLNVPVARLIYTGNASTYFTFQTVISQPTAFADDDNTAYIHTFRVDLFTKESYKELLTQTIHVLKSAGFMIDSVYGENYEEDTGFYHIPINITFLEES